MPKTVDEDFKDMEKETILFHGKTGKVTWIEFEKSIARYFRMKFGSEIGIRFGEMNCLSLKDRGQSIERSLRSIAKPC